MIMRDTAATAAAVEKKKDHWHDCETRGSSLSFLSGLMTAGGQSSDTEHNHALCLPSSYSRIHRIHRLRYRKRSFFPQSVSGNHFFLLLYALLRIFFPSSFFLLPAATDDSVSRMRDSEPVRRVSHFSFLFLLLLGSHDIVVCS